MLLSSQSSHFMNIVEQREDKEVFCWEAIQSSPCQGQPDCSPWNSISISFWQEYIQVSQAYFHCHKYTDQNEQTLTHLFIPCCVSLPHPQLRARMSHSRSDRGFSKQHVTTMTVTGGGHTDRWGIREKCRWKELPETILWIFPHLTEVAFASPLLSCCAAAFSPDLFYPGGTARGGGGEHETNTKVCSSRLSARLHSQVLYRYHGPWDAAFLSLGSC